MEPSTFDLKLILQIIVAAEDQERGQRRHLCIWDTFKIRTPRLRICYIREYLDISGGTRDADFINIQINLFLEEMLSGKGLVYLSRYS
mgnify:FL=1